MAQLPNTKESIMDEINVNANTNNKDNAFYESKENIEDDFNDNDSLKNHVDTTDFPIIDDTDFHHTIISNRGNAPPPPSSLTLASLQHFNNENPPQNMISAVDDSGGTAANKDESNHNDLNLGDIIGFGSNMNVVPDLLITPLIEMGFSRNKAIYALQQSEEQNGTMSVDIAVQWLFENPNFEPPNTENIANTIGNMLGNESHFSKNEHDSNNVPNNSPHYTHTHSNGNNVNAQIKNDDFLYSLMENVTMNGNGNGNGSSSSKSKKVYTHSSTLQSAATSSVAMDDAMNNESECKMTMNESKRVTASTINSEISALSTGNMDYLCRDYKMVIVVRKDLKMSAGKMAAQCCHGCIGLILDNGQTQKNIKQMIKMWRMNGEKKVILQCESEEKLMELKEKAMMQQVPCYLVVDAGRTQIESGSKTVLAIGPYPSIDIDPITKDLKLY